ncbi:hypothetical protein [Novipirellula artificiosorum]|uniref:Curli production assembly/transport component CsgG n=1 Tax=Novipirellula artificiosorum TaxID=2528016 RepID=A0A5C6CCN5_9BACT|nr:hypothetical protein [Novipirellula artificiosorum]TWU21872.1 hypothetical protein Poly41_71320 [Novipirellula artificiosorum]
MTKTNLINTTTVLGVLLIAIALVTQTGCLGLVSNLVHAVGADKVPADYKDAEDLEDCRLAIVTLADNSEYSDNISARLLSRYVGDILLDEIDDVRLVREDEIADWRDSHGWDTVDFATIGKGVKAEKVLGIELRNLRLRDGATLYRGRADATVMLLDAETGDLLYRKDLDEFTFPVSAGQYTSETTETRFRKLYLGMLAKQIGRLFHPYDFSETVAIDGSIASQ